VLRGGQSPRWAAELENNSDDDNNNNNNNYTYVNWLVKKY
jgi:hypothetical protein